jgi:hypothetical protein
MVFIAILMFYNTEEWYDHRMAVNYHGIKFYNIGPMWHCYKTFYRSNLPPFHGNIIILCYKVILPWKLLWNGSKLPWYINPRQSRVRITVVIYRDIVL